MPSLQKDARLFGLDLAPLGRDILTAWRGMLDWPVLAWLWPQPRLSLWLPDGTQALSRGPQTATVPMAQPKTQSGKATTAPAPSQARALARFQALVLPEDILLRRRFVMPALAQAELQAALALQLHAFSPFPLEDLVWTSEVQLAEDGKTQHIHAALSSRKLIAQHLATLPTAATLGDIEVWNAAAGQIFFSLGVAVGSQLLLSSYNGFNANAHRDALFIALGNSATSLYAGVVVFGVVGFIATTKGLAIDDVIKAGPGLAFVVYPEAVAVMDVAPLFSFMFFFMLILLAISSVCGSWEAFVASLMDEFPKLRNQRIKVMVISCFVAFLAGIPICFDSGFLLFQLMDDRSSNAILLMAFVELITISWFYGTDRFYGNIMEMKMWIPSFMAVYWKTCWFLITPIFIGFITIFSWVQKAGDQFLGYEYPPAVQAMGWGLELVSISIVVVVAVITIIQNVRNGEDVSYLKPGPMMTPKSSWGPRSDRDIEPTDGNDNTAYVS